MNAVRKKQLMLLAGGLVIIVGLSLVGGFLAQENAPPVVASEKPVTISTIVPGSTVNQKDVWMASESAKITDLNKRNAELMRTLEGIRSGELEIGKKDERTDKNEYPPAPPPPLTSPMPNFPPPSLPPASAGSTNGSNLSAVTPTQSPTGLNNRATANKPSNMNAQGANPNDALNNNGSTNLGNAGTDEGIFSLEISAAPSNEAKGASKKSSSESDVNVDESSTQETDDVSINKYLPSGSFARVVLLSGLDAPTGGQSQSNPHPVLLKVLDPAQLPNKYKANLKECLITANGYGDLSSERAYIRTDRMSCVDENGKTMDVAFKGYIAGEDGKAGMRGRLISKQGRVLANALLAGIGSGLGQAFQQSASTQSTNAVGGTTSTVNSGQEFQAGISAGVGKAMDQLAKYYITLAEKIYPVIEVDGGRVADVVITRGFSMERQ